MKVDLKFRLILFRFRGLKPALFAMLLFSILRSPLPSQTVVGKISRENMKPTAVAVYEAGNKVFIADKTSKEILIYNDTTNKQLGTINLKITMVTKIVVDEKYGKVYCLGESPSWTNETIAVIDAVRNKFIRYIELPFQATFACLAHDSDLHKVYGLCVGGFIQIDVATDVVTKIPGINGNPNRDIEVNPVTHDIYISNTKYRTLDIVNGSTLEHTKIANMYGLGVGVNYLENKAYILFYVPQSNPHGPCEFCVYDRDKNIKKRLVTDNDATKLAFNPTSNRMYSSSEVNGITTIIDGKTNEFINLPLQSCTGNPKVRHKTNHVYYAGMDYIAILNDTTQLVEIIPIDNKHPNWMLIQVIAINQKSGRVYVINDGLKLNYVTVIQDEEPMSRPPVYLGRQGVGFYPLYVFDPGSKSFAEPVQDPPYGMDYHSATFRPGGGRYYVPIEGMGFKVNTIAEYEGYSHDNLIKEIKTGGAGSKVPVVSPDSKTIYVTNSDSNDVSVIGADSYEVITRIPVGHSPMGMDVTKDGKRILVANKDDDTVSVIDAGKNSELARIDVGDSPWGLTINPSGRWAYVANNRSNTVSVIDIKKESVFATVPVGSGPRWLTCSPDGEYVWVSNTSGYSISVIDADTHKVVKTVSVTKSPEGICFLPDGGEVYVATGNVLTVVNVPDYSKKTYAPKGGGQIVSAAVGDPTSRFAGTITWAGVPLRGVLVEAYRDQIKKGRTTTNLYGDYAVHNLPPGKYEIKITKSGYVSQKRTLDVQAGQTKILDINLKKS